jgi:hypothetical protein
MYLTHRYKEQQPPFIVLAINAVNVYCGLYDTAAAQCSNTAQTSLCSLLFVPLQPFLYGLLWYSRRRFAQSTSEIPLYGKGYVITRLRYDHFCRLLESECTRYQRTANVQKRPFFARSLLRLLQSTYTDIETHTAQICTALDDLNYKGATLFLRPINEAEIWANRLHFITPLDDVF